MVVIEDAKGNQVLNATAAGRQNNFSVVGKKGKWRVRLVFFEYDGEGEFLLAPAQ